MVHFFLLFPICTDDFQFSHENPSFNSTLSRCNVFKIVHRISLYTVSQEVYQFSLSRLASTPNSVAFPLCQTFSNQIINQDLFHQGTDFPQAKTALSVTTGVQGHVSEGHIFLDPVLLLPSAISASVVIITTPR